MSEPTAPIRMLLDKLLTGWRPGRSATWDDEEHDIRARICLCCGIEGHYQRALEDHLAEIGGIDQPVYLSPDGRVWDGHHRIIAARHLGFDTIPIEPQEPPLSQTGQTPTPHNNNIETHVATPAPNHHVPQITKCTHMEYRRGPG